MVERKDVRDGDVVVVDGDEFPVYGHSVHNTVLCVDRRGNNLKYFDVPYSDIESVRRG